MLSLIMDLNPLSVLKWYYITNIGTSNSLIYLKETFIRETGYEFMFSFWRSGSCIQFKSNESQTKETVNEIAKMLKVITSEWKILFDIKEPFIGRRFFVNSVGKVGQ